MDVDEVDMTRGSDGRSLEWCEYVHQFDVVITTYQILRSDFNVARAAPLRPRREDVVYVNVERPRSPLVMVEWNRVIMDEVQMVGGGKTEYVLSFDWFHSLFLPCGVQGYGVAHSSTVVLCCIGNACSGPNFRHAACSEVSQPFRFIVSTYTFIDIPQIPSSR